ncbi:MAG: peptide transporter, partial [Ramlibacter sp.]|nr:peptide transporter [Ramlibacter sp.]
MDTQANAARSEPPSARAPRWRWLPAEGGWKYHLLLAVAGVLVLGPLAGVTAAYMNFSLGFFVGGQVLAGLLGSSVTAGYGASGRHGANYIQTAAASVASMSGLAVLIQAMVWMGLPQPPAWQLVAYMLCIGMFGVGVGMLYTPVLVDRLRLDFPSGLAVANILRALTDPALLRRAIGRLGGGVAAGLALGLATPRIAWLGAIELSMSTFGAGMVVGARIGIPVVVGGLLGWALQPFFVSIGWLAAGDPFRKITFLIALGTIMGAALVDLGLILWRAQRGLRSGVPREVQPQDDWKRVHTGRLVLWLLVWGGGIVATGHLLLGQPLFFLLFA